MDITAQKPKLAATRAGLGTALLELGRTNPKVVVLSADLSESMQLTAFRTEFPKRFFEVGVAEENMAGIAAGLAVSGYIPFVCSYAAFCVYNAIGAIRTSICYNNVPVKIIGGHSGLSATQDGATHQALEDIACMRSLPNMTVSSPIDAFQTHQAVLAAAAQDGPQYIRVGKWETPNITDQNQPFTSQALVLQEGTAATLVTTGPITHTALEIAAQHSVEVIAVASIKPLDTQTIIASLQKTRRLITLEEHQLAGGLASALAEELLTHNPRLLEKPAVFLAVKDSFGQSGTQNELLTFYGLDVSSIATAIQTVLD